MQRWPTYHGGRRFELFEQVWEEVGVLLQLEQYVHVV